MYCGNDHFSAADAYDAEMEYQFNQWCEYMREMEWEHSIYVEFIMPSYFADLDLMESSIC